MRDRDQTRSKASLRGAHRSCPLQCLVFENRQGGGGGGEVVSFVSKAANYNLALTDYVVSFTATATAFLPLSPPVGTSYRIKNNSPGTLTIQTISGGALIDGSATAVLPVQYTSVDLVYDSFGNWEIF